MEGELSLVSNLPGYLYLLVTTIGVQCGEDFRIPDSINKLVYYRYRIRVPGRDGV